MASRPFIFELHGPDMYTSKGVHDAFDQVSGKKIEMQPIPQDGLVDFYGAVFPPMVAAAFAEMNASYLPGGILYEGYQPAVEKKHGDTGLLDVVKEIYGA